MSTLLFFRLLLMCVKLRSLWAGTPLAAPFLPTIRRVLTCPRIGTKSLTCSRRPAPASWPLFRPEARGGPAVPLDSAPGELTQAL